MTSEVMERPPRVRYREAMHSSITTTPPPDRHAAPRLAPAPAPQPARPRRRGRGLDPPPQLPRDRPRASRAARWCCAWPTGSTCRCASATCCSPPPALRRFRRAPLDDPALAAGRAAVEMVLKAHEPWPALALDRHWNMLAYERGRAAADRRLRRRAAAAAGERPAPEPASRTGWRRASPTCAMARPPALPPRPADRGQRRRGAGGAARGAEPLSAARAPTGSRRMAASSDVVVPLVLDSRLGGSRSSARRRCSARRRRPALGAGARDLSSRPTRRRRPRCEAQAEVQPPNAAAGAFALPAPGRRVAPPRGRTASCRSGARRASAGRARRAPAATPRPPPRRAWRGGRRRRRHADAARIAAARVPRTRAARSPARRPSSRVRPAAARSGTSRAASTNADCSAMLMPSPTIGCASPAALPMRKQSPSPRRGRAARRGEAARWRARDLRASPPSQRARRRAHSRRSIASNTSPARAPGLRPRAAAAAGRRGCSRRASRCRRRRRPCRRSRRRTTAPAASRRRSRRRESSP